LEIMRGGDTEAGEKNKQKLISKNLSAWMLIICRVVGYRLAL
jgi:hypothetical protein